MSLPIAPPWRSGPAPTTLNKAPAISSFIDRSRKQFGKSTVFSVRVLPASLWIYPDCATVGVTFRGIKGFQLPIPDAQFENITNAERWACAVNRAAGVNSIEMLAIEADSRWSDGHTSLAASVRHLVSWSVPKGRRVCCIIMRNNAGYGYVLVDPTSDCRVAQPIHHPTFAASEMEIEARQNARAINQAIGADQDEAIHAATTFRGHSHPVLTRSLFESWGVNLFSPSYEATVRPSLLEVL